MEELTDDQIRIFLEEAVIYTQIEYLRPRVNRGDLYISQIDSHCLACDQVRPFKSLHSRGGRGGSAVMTGITHYDFECFGCNRSHLLFSVHHLFGDKTVVLTKYGEFPRKSLPRDKVLQKFLADDQEYYQKAIACLANGYGIGAFCYFRRVVENNIVKLLELLSEDVSATGGKAELMEKIEELKTASPMSEKIDVANHALPEYLVPSGLNPLGRLYKVLSEGVHSLSDNECLERALAVEGCLKYLVGELASRKKNRDDFAGMVGKL